MLRVGTRAGQKEGGRDERLEEDEEGKESRGRRSTRGDVTGIGGGGQSAEVRNLKSCEKRTRISFCHFATISSSWQPNGASSGLQGR